MKILLIEDENDKIKHITSHLKKKIKGIELCVAKSYKSGIISIYQQQYDLILLDMSLPLNDVSDNEFMENEFETFGGMDILEEMKRIENETKVIVITAFDVLGENENKMTLDQLNEIMARKYCKIYLGCIHYNSSAREWKYILDSYLDDIINN